MNKIEVKKKSGKVGGRGEGGLILVVVVVGGRGGGNGLDLWVVVGMCALYLLLALGFRSMICSID